MSMTEPPRGGTALEVHAGDTLGSVPTLSFNHRSRTSYLGKNEKDKKNSRNEVEWVSRQERRLK